MILRLKEQVMSVRNLDAIFRPNSVALIGASAREHSIGNLVARSLLGAGFGGQLQFVNPHAAEVCGMEAYPDVASLPAAPDVAVICTPPAIVPELIGELGGRGTKGAIVITAGFGELGASGKELQQRMLDAARPHLMRIVGPNCLGVISTGARMNASFAHISAIAGRVAFVAQSGAMLTTVLDWATARSIGFSHLVSLGDMSDVDFGDMLDYLAVDTGTDAILLYIEGVTQARKFMSAARAASRLKPVIAIKAGRYPAAAHAAASHTGALAGLDKAYDAAFRRAGVLRVYDLDEVFDALETLANRPPLVSDDLIVLTNGGGVGVLAADAISERGIQLTELGEKTVSQLTKVLPAAWSHANPVDIIGDADGSRYAAALNILTAAEPKTSVLVLNCPTAVASSIDAAMAVVAEAKKSQNPIFTSWLGQTAARESRQLFERARIPTFDTPEKAVRGFMHCLRYKRGQEALMEVPPSLPATFQPDIESARKLIAEALACGEAWLSPQRLWPLLECYAIPIPRWAVVRDAEQASSEEHRFDAPVALKILSPDILHKSDVGGVALGLKGADAIRAAAGLMLKSVTHGAPKARIEGFFLQEMIERPHAYELIAGMIDDETFGPLLLFGHGGTAVEAIDDTAMALPPLNIALARELISRPRLYRLLKGYRNVVPVALEAIATTLVRISQMVCDIPEIAELDINPLLADAAGVVALDARIRLSPRDPARRDRLAIRPYPKELERKERLAGIGTVIIRPIRPDDSPALHTLFQSLSADDIRMRFFTPLGEMPDKLRARLTQIDYDREMAFVLVGEQGIVGVARLAADPDNIRAEFAVVVHGGFRHKGVGRFLLDALIAYARERGITELFGEILAENKVMLRLCGSLGFTLQVQAGGIVHAVLHLAEN